MVAKARSLPFSYDGLPDAAVLEQDIRQALVPRP